MTVTTFCRGVNDLAESAKCTTMHTMDYDGNSPSQDCTRNCFLEGGRKELARALSKEILSMEP